ncbi:MAG: hypothetical protein LBJ12_05555 [Oscillospiraceae bacterium]|jgi:serine/threonine-protein kinase|nr:hypothetical protein [Oscillospiraceae bacterium]
MQTFDEFKAGLKNFVLLTRGGQKAVFGAIHPHYGSVVVKLFFQNDLRSQRELDISEDTTFDCVPVIYEDGHMLYEDVETLYIIEQRISGKELRERIRCAEYFSLSEAVGFLEQ